jgi:hypothetical protein
VREVRAGPNVTLRGSLGSSESIGAVGRRRARAGARAQVAAAMAGGGGRGGALRRDGAAFIGALALGDEG